MTFDVIAEELLKVHGYEVLKCSSDKEAIYKTDDLREGSNKYPVHFSVSNTSGEKDYEEFYTNEEKVDMERFEALGIVVEKSIPDTKKIVKLFEQLENEFQQEVVTKEKVVSILKEYLPNFEHIETGKSLDIKM